jgi:hypothetical protein
VEFSGKINHSRIKFPVFPEQKKPSHGKGTAFKISGGSDLFFLVFLFLVFIVAF